MIAIYRFSMEARCPSDHLPDLYEIKVISHRTIKVEELLAAAAEIGGAEKHLSQEDITVELARRFAVKVVSRGYHYGCLTEVRA